MKKLIYGILALVVLGLLMISGCKSKQCNEPPNLDGYTQFGATINNGLAEFSSDNAMFKIRMLPITPDGSTESISDCQQYANLTDTNYIKTISGLKVYSFSTYDQWYQFLVCGKDRIIITNNPQKYVDIVC